MPRLILTTLVILLVVVPPCQAEPMLNEGTHELAVHFSPDFKSAIGDDLRLDFGYGWFIADRFAVRGNLHRILMEDIAAADSDYRVLQIDLSAEYHFLVGESFVPYVGGTVGWRRNIFGALDESGAIYGGRFGFKYFLADNVALDYLVTVTASSKDVYVNDFEADNRDFSSMLGIHVFF